jgi:hypothetical protein
LEIFGAAVSQLAVKMPSKPTYDDQLKNEPRTMFRYRILRYLPNLVREEYVNIGVLLEEINTPRVVIRLVEEPHEFARIRRFHPEVDEAVLRNLAGDLESRLQGNTSNVSGRVEFLSESLSNAIQFSAAKPSLAGNIDEELDRLYGEHVAVPYRASVHIVEYTRDWMRDKLKEVFRHHRLMEKLTQRANVETYTQPGDPFRLDYGYQNGIRGFIHVVSLGGDTEHAKVLAYTAERIHARDARAKITAITEVAPTPTFSRHQFVERLFAEQNIEIVSMSRVEEFAEALSKSLA